MQSPDFTNFESEFEIKIERHLSGKDLKEIMQKLSIQIWNRLCQDIT